MRLTRTKYPAGAIIRWLWRHHRGCRLQAVANAAAGLLLIGLGLWGVELLRQLTDTATGTRQGSLITLAALLCATAAGEMAVHAAQTWIRATLGVRSQNTMQRQFFERLLTTRYQSIGHLHSGDILNRLFGDVSDIVALLTEVVPQVVIVCAQFAASFIYLYLMEPALALILVATAPVFVLLSRFYFAKMRRIVRHIKDSNSAIQAIIQETVQHRTVVQVMERAGTMTERLTERQRQLRAEVKSRARFGIIAKVTVNIGFAGGYLAALIYGLVRLQDGLITVGVLIAFTQLISRIQRPLLDMARLLPVMVNSLTASERLMELEEAEREPPARPQRLGPGTGVRIEDVTYHYGGSQRPVLQHLTHTFAPHTFTAVTGESGAGKTTLVRLLLALMQPDEGAVTLFTADGRESAATPSTRCNFAYVPQGNTLFSGTLRDNLRLGRPTATDQDMQRALAMAAADFATRLPDGLDTHLGEGGTGLSEGQAQRIAIARALLRPCSILLLDEATSALDTATEARLIQNLRTHYRRLTIIFITHRNVPAEADQHLHLTPA